MHLFYSPDINPKTSIYTFSPEESRHCCRVLRLGRGEQITLTDGKGARYFAIIDDAKPNKVVARIIEREAVQSVKEYQLHVAIAPTKRMERFEWFVEKATEVGVDEITPIITQNTERKVLNADRLQKKMISAVKQSMNLILPVLNQAIGFEELLKQVNADKRAIAHCKPTFKPYLKDAFPPKGKYLVLIGPEGDFSDEEITKARDAGFVEISLGESRLRTETAALMACIEVGLLNRK